MQISTTLDAATPRQVQVDESTRMKPKIVERLHDWLYLERSVHRMIAGWGRHMAEWQDKISTHRHIWDQAEIVRRLSLRTNEFLGGNPNAPVSAKLEELVNTVLLAPSHQDAVDGIYQIFTGALVKGYLNHVQGVHPVHDAPSIQLLQEIVTIKEQHRLWLREYRRRYPHRINAAYLAAINEKLAACENLEKPLPLEAGKAAQPVGVNTSFRLPASAARPAGAEPKHDFMPYLEPDFPRSIETRRLFWAYGYMRELNLADEQLRWIYDGHFMPWEFLYDVSRHLWDESRHGDSGHSRLLDFGITIQDIGFSDYENYGPGPAEPMTPKDLYERVFFIGMVAETGHFEVKNEAYKDFKEGGDMESAEMMLFDIIDETMHVQYAHRWLPILAERAGVDNSSYRERSVEDRKRLQAEMDKRRAEHAKLPRADSNPDYAFYQKLLQIMRDKQPLSNASTCPERSPMPM